MACNRHDFVRCTFEVGKTGRHGLSQAMCRAVTKARCVTPLSESVKGGRSMTDFVTTGVVVEIELGGYMPEQVKVYVEAGGLEDVF